MHACVCVWGGGGGTWKGRERERELCNANKVAYFCKDLQIFELYSTTTTTPPPPSPHSLFPDLFMPRVAFIVFTRLVLRTSHVDQEEFRTLKTDMASQNCTK